MPHGGIPPVAPRLIRTLPMESAFWLSPPSLPAPLERRGGESLPFCRVERTEAGTVTARFRRAGAPSASCFSGGLPRPPHSPCGHARGAICGAAGPCGAATGGCFWTIRIASPGAASGHSKIAHSGRLAHDFCCPGSPSRVEKPHDRAAPPGCRFGQSQIFMPGGSNRQSVSRASRANPGRGFCQKSALSGLRLGLPAFKSILRVFPTLLPYRFCMAITALLPQSIWQ
jgi:hypothetical protein